MTTHVFIVDSTTFKLHLEYLFAGTGARDLAVDFNNSSTTTMPAQTENNLVSMIADVSRVRAGDLILFYLQQNYKEGIMEGKFYGIFKVIPINGKICFFDQNDNNQFLKRELNKSLTFRVKIEPYQVYPEGVTEWEALDDIQNIVSPNQMLWSLIYRKLKGNRGCTPITVYESQRLCNLIRARNNGVALSINNHKITFDKTTEKIILTQDKIPRYAGRTEELNIFPRLKQKYMDNLAFESHLQAYISYCLSKNINKSLDNLLLKNRDVVWIGNEVSCGVGMQRIDILFVTKEEEQYFHNPVELKSAYASEDNIRQLSRYMNWLYQYYIPNFPGNICPILITKKIPEFKVGRRKEYKYETENEYSHYYQNIINKFEEFNKQYNCKLKFIEYELVNNKLNFVEVLY
jgi:hypothetical protein